MYTLQLIFMCTRVAELMSTYKKTAFDSYTNLSESCKDAVKNPKTNLNSIICCKI